ncbi:MAG: DUF5684 domain-containing protein [Candidatus Xenobia bacterium]
MQHDAGGIAAISNLVALAIAIVAIVGMWKVFEKAGKPGWAAIIPIYNLWVMVEIAGMPVWWVILCFIPIANIVAAIMINIAIARAFGKDAAFGVLALTCCSFIGYPMLGFGDAQYQGPGA